MCWQLWFDNIFYKYNLCAQANRGTALVDEPISLYCSLKILGSFEMSQACAESITGDHCTMHAG